MSVWLRRNYPQYFSTYSIEGDPVQKYLDPAAWKCTLVWAAYNGLPLSLDKVGAVLGFEEQKLKDGKELIRYFCMPSRTAGRKWNLPEHAPEKWEQFKKYNRRDVEVEMQIQQRLKNYPVPDFVWDEYHLDQEINDRGIMIDSQLVEQAISIDDQTKKDLMARMQKLTGLDNPNSVMQLKGYLQKLWVKRTSLPCLSQFMQTWQRYLISGCSLPKAALKSTRQCRMQYAQITEREDCSAFTELIAPGGSQAKSCSFRTWRGTA